MGALASIDNATGHDRIKPQLASTRHHFWSVASRVQPKLIAPFDCDFFENRDARCGWQIQADAIELLDWNISQGWVAAKSLNRASLEINRVDVIPPD